MENTYPENFDSSNLNEEQNNILLEFFHKRHLFNEYLLKENINLFTCPGCSYPTITERGNYEICPVCNWEDDNQDDKEADQVWGGPNYQLSLTENRLNIGAILMNLTKENEGSVNLDPKEVLQILSQHNGQIHKIVNKLPSDADLNHPVVEKYTNAEKNLLHQLVKK